MDLGKLLGGLDAAKAGEAIDFVWNNRDRLTKLLDVVKDLPDDALGKLGGIPKMLAGVGDGLAEAGQQARVAAQSLVGEDGEGGARQALTGSASTMDEIRQQLTKVSGLVAGVADQLGKVPMLGGPVKPLAESAQTLTGTVAQMESLAGYLRSLADVLSKVGVAFTGLGDKLDGSGGALRQLTSTAG